MVNSDRQPGKPYIMACMPAFNEEGSIAKVILKTKPYVDQIVVCDDGSEDMTAAIASGLGAIVIRHPKREGYGSALASLFQAAKESPADIMLTLDADGQHDPEFIPELVAPITNKTADIVIGSRFLGGSDVPRVRKLGIKIINDVTNAAGYKDLTDSQSGFRAYDRAAINSIMPVENGMGASTEILVKAKANSLKVTEVPVVINYEGASPSEGQLRHGTSVFLNTIKHISIEHPLFLFGIPGIILLSVGFYFGGFGLDILFTQGHLPVNIALVAIGALIFGFMLIMTMLILWVLSSILKDLRNANRQTSAMLNHK